LLITLSLAISISIQLPECVGHASFLASIFHKVMQLCI